MSTDGTDDGRKTVLPATDGPADTKGDAKRAAGAETVRADGHVDGPDDPAVPPADAIDTRAPGFKGWLLERLSEPNDSTRKILFVAVALCLLCSVVVSAAAIALRPLQSTNAELDRRSNILEVAGMLEPGADVEALFSDIERRMVDLEAGEFTDAVDPDTYDQRAAASDPNLSDDITNDEDLAGIGRRAKYAEVYLLTDGDAIEQVIVPVHGLGLWSTLYGFVALEGDLRTIAGLQFYDHAETPGLGGEVDNPAWRQKWQGKLAFDEAGELRIRVMKGAVDPNSPDAPYRVDGLAGATLTSNGVTNLLQFWLGENGFGPFLARLGSGEIS